MGDAEERTHFEVGDFLFVEDFDGEAGLFGHCFGFLGKDARSEFVGRLVDQVAREILGVGDDAAFRKTFVASSAFRIGVAKDGDGFDVLIVFSVGLVFVGFEIGGESAFGDDLGRLLDGVALADEKRKIFDRAGFQIA